MNGDLCCRMATLFIHIVCHSYVRRVAKHIEILILIYRSVVENTTVAVKLSVII